MSYVCFQRVVGCRGSGLNLFSHVIKKYVFNSTVLRVQKFHCLCVCVHTGISVSDLLGWICPEILTTVCSACAVQHICGEPRDLDSMCHMSCSAPKFLYIYHPPTWVLCGRSLVVGQRQPSLALFSESWKVDQVLQLPRHL